MNWTLRLFLLLSLYICITPCQAQDEEPITAYEFSMDQDFLADFVHDDPEEAYNYTAGLRLGIYGELANHPYLGLPYVRQKLDGWLIDPLINLFSFWHEEKSHNFVMTINGFSPRFISDETQLFIDTTANGYQLQQDLPFSSFTGFRSSRRIEADKVFAHTRTAIDYAFTSSFSFGFTSLGLTRGVENLFGARRPNGNLWKKNDQAPYPTGQLNHTMVPLFMYSLSMETVLWRPIKKVMLQVRPEINLGYYTDVGIGFDFGKVMNTNRFIDNLSYTDTNNPGLVSISNEDMSFSLVCGGVIRAVFYNVHYHGMFGWNRLEEYAWADTKKYMLEGYVGAKLQFIKKLEFNFSVNTRSPMIKGEQGKYNTWGTLGFKYLIGEEGEGCHDDY